tara:strand:- start:521 stop:676 length:156 start_codon:yes stop_codon:yes gene_type:complete
MDANLALPSSTIFSSQINSAGYAKINGTPLHSSIDSGIDNFQSMIGHWGSP